MKKMDEVELDHVDRCIANGLVADVPDIELAVEGIVSRIAGLDKRFQRMMEATLADAGFGEPRPGQPDG